MVEEIAFENGRVSNFEGLVTLTLDQVILHTIVHQPSTTIYMPTHQMSLKSNTLCVDRWTDGHLKSQPKIEVYLYSMSFEKSGLCMFVENIIKI